ncbi:MAG: Base plate wedge protein 53 [Reyranellaceae bacterium]
MATDPVQALIDAGAIPTNPFGPDSRYTGIAFGLYQRNPTDPAIAYVLRRFIPRPRDIPVALEHIVQSGERLDLLAAQIFGNAELYWRIADANAVTDPFETTDTLGGRIVIPAATGS